MSYFPTKTCLGRIGPFEFVRKRFNRGTQYEVEARFGQRKLWFTISRRTFRLELRAA